MTKPHSSNPSAQSADRASAQAMAVEFQNLTFAFGERVILNQINLAIPKGKVTAIMGPSGTGKTTFLHLIGGLLRPKSGNIQALGHSVQNLRRKELFQYRRHLGMLFQSGALFTDLSVYDNVAFPLRVHTKLPEVMIRDIVLMKLEAVGLRGAHALMPSELSGGMSRRVALARAIALDPDVMLYDEPFTGQDPISMGVLVKLIRTINDALQLTSVIVSHDVKEVFTIADYVYILSGGAIIGAGTPAELADARSPEVDQFIHGRPDGPVRFHYPAPDLATDFLQEGAR